MGPAAALALGGAAFAALLAAFGAGWGVRGRISEAESVPLRVEIDGLQARVRELESQRDSGRAAGDAVVEGMREIAAGLGDPDPRTGVGLLLGADEDRGGEAEASGGPAA